MMDGIKKRNLKVKILSDRSSLSREMMGLFKEILGNRSDAVFPGL